jgi:proteasome lid subunit RPN8/RPN11
MPKQPYRLLKKPLQNMISKAVKLSRKGGREICGLLVDNGYFLECLEVKNAAKCGGSFTFHLKEIHLIEKAVSTRGHSIVGTFHSHPLSLAQPGDIDLSGIVEPELMLIIDCLDKEARLWRIAREKAYEVQFELL